MLGVPLMREGTPIGVLAMTRSRPRPFTAAQIELNSTFADQAVIAIETLRLFNEVQERTAETERTRKVMQTAFDNMGDGVALLDKDMRLQFMSQERIKSRQFPPELVHPGVPARELMLFQARRGDYGPVTDDADIERKIDAAFARMTTPGGTRYVRPENGRYIEFSFKPISDGGLLAVFRDITELREREEALAAAKEDVERTRELMQTVLDNMGDGVTLWDKDFRWKFSNRVHIERQHYTPDMLHPGTTGYDMIRFQAQRGEYGDLSGAEQENKVQEVASIIRNPKGGRYERRTSSGRYIEFTYRPLADGSTLGVYRDITELKGPRAGGRAGAQHHAVGAGQHERRGNAVRCPLSPEIHQPAPRRLPSAPARRRRAKSVAVGYPAVSGQARRLSAPPKMPRSSPARALSLSPSRAAAISSGARRTAGISSSVSSRSGIATSSRLSATSPS